MTLEKVLSPDKHCLSIICFKVVAFKKSSSKAFPEFVIQNCQIFMK